MAEFDGDPEAAEADLRRASDAVAEAGDLLDEAKARAEQIEQESFDGSPEAEADISQRMDGVQRKIEFLEQKLADAEGDLQRTIDHWTELGYLP